MYALWLAFFLPILPATLGWILLLDPNYGIINGYAEQLIGIPLLNIYSLAGITWVHLTLSTIPIMVILIEPAQRFIDTSYEEASTMSGAGTFTTLRRVTVPLIAADAADGVHRRLDQVARSVRGRAGAGRAGRHPGLLDADRSICCESSRRTSRRPWR